MYLRKKKKCRSFQTAIINRSTLLTFVWPITWYHSHMLLLQCCRFLSFWFNLGRYTLKQTRKWSFDSNSMLWYTQVFNLTTGGSISGAFIHHSGSCYYTTFVRMRTVLSDHVCFLYITKAVIETTLWCWVQLLTLCVYLAFRRNACRGFSSNSP